MPMCNLPHTAHTGGTLSIILKTYTYMNRFVLLFGLLFTFQNSNSQVLIMNTIEGQRNPKLDYEYGYLPGRKFQFYQTIKNYDLKGLSIRVELYDDRRKLNLKTISCSPLTIENISEFADSKTIYKFAQYTDMLLRQANAVIDSASKELIEIHLEAIDSRLIGFGYVKVHGLCQIKVMYKGLIKSYCVDIKDGDENSPLGGNAFVTRKGGTRIMGSASMREVIEQFIADLTMMN